MKHPLSAFAACVTLVMLVTVHPVRAEESLSAAEFAARCAASGGNLTLVEDLAIDGGAAELDQCAVTAGSFTLKVERARLSSTGFLRVFGEAGGEIIVEQSILAQSGNATGPVNILLRAHRVRITRTTLDFSGSVHLETGRADRGEVHVLNSTLRSVTADIHVGSSGGGHEGRTRIEDSDLIARVDISVLASALETGARGEVSIEDSILESSGTITLQTGDEGRTKVFGNDGNGIHAAATITIISGTAGTTLAHNNRIVGEGGVRLLSGGRTRVRMNDFTGSRDVSIEGLRCDARDNIPPVECAP